jgi:4-hydroxythreonine-4-phosphate dehydrogenase
VNKIGITCGDPAGVGPELIIKLKKSFSPRVAHIIYCSPEVLEKARTLLSEEFPFREIEKPEEASEPGVYLIDPGLSAGWDKPSLSSGRASLMSLARALADAMRGAIGGILTMPISKYWAKRAGFSFPGQTEYLAHACGVKDFAMMMYSEKIKVALLSTHLPLKEALKLIRKERIVELCTLINEEFQRLFGKKPRIGVVGINPHAGEGGDLGREEVEEIGPAVRELREKGIHAHGPLVPDSAFLRPQDYDLFLAMYHDQGLIPFKLLSFKSGVNLTLGLPFPRTSPDHGTAYDIAWKGVADPGPSQSALELLTKLVENLKG